MTARTGGARALHLLLGAALAVAVHGCDDGDADADADPVEDAGAGGAAGGAGAAGSDGTGGGDTGGGAGGGDTGGGAGGGDMGGGEGGGAGGGEGGGAGGGDDLTGICGPGIDVLDFADAVQEGDTWVFRGSMSGNDDYTGGCDTSESPGSDRVIRVVAPEAGSWSFSTAGSSARTIVYALGDCRDGFSERACSAGDDRGAEILVQLSADEEVFLIVDRWVGTPASDFVLTAEILDVAAPTLDGGDGHFNPANNGISISATGSDADNDLQGFELDMLDQNGEQALQTLEANFDQVGFVQLTQADGMFTFTLAGGLNVDLVPATARLTVFDALGQRSNTIDIPLQPPVGVGRGEACDPFLAATICENDDDTCVDEGEGPVCRLSTPPVLEGGSAWVNAEAGVFGVRLAGTDAEADAFFWQAIALDGEGNEIAFGENPGFAGIGFEAIAQMEGGAYEGIGSIDPFFVQRCLPGAQQAFNACAQGGGTQQQCTEEANGVFEACADDIFPTVTALRVRVGDRTGRFSEPMDLELVATPAVEEGAGCDVAEAIGICPEDLVCFNLGGTDELPICQAPATPCPQSWPVVDLAEHADNGSWRYQGDSTDAEALGGGGSCGGGGPNGVHAFTAEAGGRYTAEISGANGDTLMYVRSHCALQQAAYELACNDDIAQRNLLSRASFELEAGETAYIFVDGFRGGFAGRYILTVTRQ